MKNPRQAARWRGSHDRGANAHARRIDGVMLRRVWSGRTDADWWAFVAEIGGETVQLSADHYEKAKDEIDERWPLADWWRPFIKCDRDTEGRGR